MFRASHTTCTRAPVTSVKYMGETIEEGGQAPWSAAPAPALPWPSHSGRARRCCCQGKPRRNPAQARMESGERGRRPARGGGVVHLSTPMRRLIGIEELLYVFKQPLSLPLQSLLERRLSTFKEAPEPLQMCPTFANKRTWVTKGSRTHRAKLVQKNIFSQKNQKKYKHLKL